MTIESIARQRRMISLESNTLSNALSAATDRLPTYVADVKSFLFTLFASEPTIAPRDLGKPETITLLKKIPYVTLQSNIVYVPPGLSVPYLELAKALADCEPVATGLYNDILIPFDKWISALLSNPEKLSSITTANIPGLKLHNLERSVKELAACFHAPQTQTEVSFGNAFKRVSDVDTAADLLNKTVIKASHRTYSDVREAVNFITQHIDTLIRRINENPETYKLSGSVTAALADITHNMAIHCEFYSGFQYQLLSTVKAFKDTEVKLKEDLTAGATHATSDDYALEHDSINTTQTA